MNAVGIYFAPSGPWDFIVGIPGWRALGALTLGCFISRLQREDIRGDL